MVFVAASSAQTKPLLTLTTEDGKTTNFTSADLAKIKLVTVKATEHGTAATFEGVPLVAVLKAGGVVFGEPLRGKRLASYLLVMSSDGYRIVFALPELDPGFTDKLIILADARDGKPLDAKAGPLQIVVPDEKRPARWARMVTSLKIVAAP